MPKSVKARRLSHMNVVVADFDASVRHFEDLFGGVFMKDLDGPNWHAYLVEIGGVIFEPFVPKNFMLHGRIGPHYLGVEYEADMDEARGAVADHGIRIMRDIVEAIHTDPFDGFGVDYEFFGGTFYGPDAKHVTTPTKPEGYWIDGHPIGFTGLKGYTHAVADIEAASRFLQSFLEARPQYTVDRPHLAARAVGLQVADDLVELVSPVGPGPLLDEMLRTGQGVRSTLFGVTDIERARAYFLGRGVRLVEGTAPGSFAIDPRDNLGLLFEFAK
jgi:catechol 2,3-dioxygenase-like lactoylglutathione lyase family enzyme